MSTQRFEMTIGLEVEVHDATEVIRSAAEIVVDQHSGQVGVMGVSDIERALMHRVWQALQAGLADQSPRGFEWVSGSSSIHPVD